MSRLEQVHSNELLLKGARLVDPLQELDRVADLRIREGRIAEIGENLSPEDADCAVLELDGLYLVPGFIDLRARFGEPGREDRETIASGLEAAAAGGFVGVCVTPETEPACDNAGAVEFMLSRAEPSTASLLPMGAVTRGLAGERLADMGELARAGISAYCEGVTGLGSAAILRGALSYSRMFGLPLFEQPTEESLGGGEVHEGSASLRMGLMGIPRIAEELAVYRGIRVAEYEGAHLHLQLLSTTESLELVRSAKTREARISCDASPQHLALNSEAVLEFNPTLRLLPPLRPEDDRQALVRAAVDGTLDALCSDHRPAEFDELDREYGYCPFGCASLETAFPVAWQALVEPGHCDLARLIALFSDGPRRILGLPRPGFQAGEPAELTILDLECSWTFRTEESLSLGMNSPWEGRTFSVRPMGIVNGDRIALREDGED